MTNLREMSDETLAALYATCDEDTAAAILREAARRDRKDAQSAYDRAWWKRVSAEWLDFAHAQYLAAVAATNGYLLSREGLAAGIDEWSLWTGSAKRAEKFASPELNEFWSVSKRMTVSQYAWNAGRPRRDEAR